MNTVKKLLCLAVASIALNVQTQGQIKIDDGSFVPKVKELEVIEVIPEELKYSEVLDFQSKPIEDEDLRTKLENRGEIVAARKSLLSKRGANLYNNIVGEVVYLNKVPQNINQFCISADTSEISWKEPIKKGYYTVIVQFDRKNGKNLFERHKSMVLDGIDDGSIRLRGVKQEIIRFFDYYYSNHGGIVEYVLQDETGKLYYVSDEIEDVSLSFYNKVVEMILDKDIYLLTDYDTITDYLTGKKIDVHGFRTVNFGYDNLFHYLKYNYNPYLDTYKWDTYDYKKEIEIIFEEDRFTEIWEKDKVLYSNPYHCTDVFLRDENLIAVINTGQGEFTLNIDFIDNGMVYSEVKRHGRSGLISKSFAEEVANHLHIEKTASEQKKKAEEQKRLQQEEQSKQKRKQELISKYGEKFGTMINERKVAIGMTTAMCKESVGYPSDTYSVTTSDGVSLVWVYYGKVYLYFYNNVLYRIDRQS